MNLKNRETRRVLNRKILRNIVKNNKEEVSIQYKWRKFQIGKYGVSKWCYMFNKNNRNNKTNFITPEDAMKNIF